MSDRRGHFDKLRTFGQLRERQATMPSSGHTARWAGPASSAVSGHAATSGRGCVSNEIRAGTRPKLADVVSPEFGWNRPRIMISCKGESSIYTTSHLRPGARP